MQDETPLSTIDIIRRFELILKLSDALLKIYSTGGNTNALVYELYEAPHLAITGAIAQIGELLNQLPENFTAQYTALEWQNYVRHRNIVAHEYEDTSRTFIDDYMRNKLPDLQDFCRKFIAAYKRNPRCYVYDPRPGVKNPIYETTSTRSEKTSGSPMTVAEKARAKTPGMFSQNKPHQ